MIAGLRPHDEDRQFSAEHNRSTVVPMSDMASSTGLLETAVQAEEEIRWQVLAAAGLTDSVDSDQGLVFPLPTGAKIVRVISGYDTRDTTNTKVRCAACKQHQLHNRGFRVEIEGGEQARIGLNCGEKHFGDGAWQAAVADYDRRVQHAHYLARVKPACDAIEQIMPLVREWHQRTNLLAKWMPAFSAQELFGVLAGEAKRSEGRLERERRRKRKRVNRQGREETYVETEIIVVARIPYPGMFLGQTPTHPLNGAITEVGCAIAIFENKSDAVSLAKAFAHLRWGRQYLNDAAEIHRGALQNLKPDWLPSLCEWANSELEETYTVRGSTIKCDEETFTLLAPEAIGTPPIDRINELWP